MNRRRIKTVIENKLDHWLSSIKDDNLRANIRNNVIVSGGCITSMFLNEPVNDFDIYFRDVEVAKMVAEYYVNKFKGKKQHMPDIDVVSLEDRVSIKIQSAGVATSDDESFDDLKYSTEYIHKEDRGKYEPVCITDNAITLTDKIQIVIRFIGTAAEIHKNFDFIHCQCYYDSNSGELVVTPEAIESILTRELKYSGSLYPIATLFRLRKFIKRGWNINAGQIFKIAYQIKDFDLNNIDVLRDQLCGVDILYFAELIRKLKDSDVQVIESAYIMQLVDECFS